jgi:hypothetical protein
VSLPSSDFLMVAGLPWTTPTMLHSAEARPNLEEIKATMRWPALEEVLCATN